MEDGEAEGFQKRTSSSFKAHVSMRLVPASALAVQLGCCLLSEESPTAVRDEGKGLITLVS